MGESIALCCCTYSPRISTICSLIAAGANTQCRSTIFMRGRVVASGIHERMPPLEPLERSVQLPCSMFFIMQFRSASSCLARPPAVHQFVAAAAARPAAAVTQPFRTMAATQSISAEVKQVQTMYKTPPSTGTGAVYPAQYEEQLASKIDKVKDLFAAHKLPDIEVHRSSTEHFRMRTEFRMWHEVRPG